MHNLLERPHPPNPDFSTIKLNKVAICRRETHKHNVSHGQNTLLGCALYNYTLCFLVPHFLSPSLCSTTCLSGGSPVTATSCPFTKRWNWTSCNEDAVECCALKGKNVVVVLVTCGVKLCVEKFSTSPTIHTYLLEICSRCPTTCNSLCVGERFEADFGPEPPTRNKLDASVIRSKVPLAQHPLLYGS